MRQGESLGGEISHRLICGIHDPHWKLGNGTWLEEVGPWGMHAFEDLKGSDSLSLSPTGLFSSLLPGYCKMNSSVFQYSSAKMS